MGPDAITPFKFCFALSLPRGFCLVHLIVKIGILLSLGVDGMCGWGIVDRALKGPADPLGLLPEIRAQQAAGKRLLKEEGDHAFYLGGRYYYVTLYMAYQI